MVSIYGAMTAERKSRIWEAPPDELHCMRHCQASRDRFFMSSEPYHGGIMPRTRTRRAECLSIEEREPISRGLASGASYRAIGRELILSASTISREVRLNGGPAKYRPYDGEKQFFKRDQRPKPYLLSGESERRNIATRWFKLAASSEQN